VFLEVDRCESNTKWLSDVAGPKGWHDLTLRGMEESQCAVEKIVRSAMHRILSQTLERVKRKTFSKRNIPPGIAADYSQGTPVWLLPRWSVSDFSLPAMRNTHAASLPEQLSSASG
jgi:hypothetical protein